MGSCGSKRKERSASASSKQQEKQKNSKSEAGKQTSVQITVEREDINSAAVGERRDETDTIHGSTEIFKNGMNDESAATAVALTLHGKSDSSANGRRARCTSFYDTVDAAEILPYLIVGNLASSRNLGFLKRKNVGFLLNLTTEGEAGGQRRRASNQEMGIERLQVQMEDDEDEEISGHFEVCFEFINRAKAAASPSDDKKKFVSPKTALVHSNYGLSRTSVIVLAYLMKEKRWSLRKANEHLRKCRPSAKPNDGFVVQLLRYEQELHGKMSMTLKDFYQQP